MGETPQPKEPTQTPSDLSDEAKPLVTHTSQPGAPTKTKKKLGLVAGIIAATVVVLLGTGSALAYNLWYQNPQKTLADAMVNAMKAKTVAYTGEFTIDIADSSAGYKDLKLTVEGKNGTVDGEVTVDFALTTTEGDEYKVSGAGLFDKDGNLFFKVNKLRELIDQFGQGRELPASITAIIDKVDGSWVRIAADDLKEYSKEYAEQQECTRDALKKIEGNQNTADEVANLYRQHQFIVIKEELGVKDGNVGYVLDTDRQVAKEFVKGLKETELYKELAKCNDTLEDIDEEDLTVDEDDADSDTKTRFAVYISRIGHELREVHFDIEDDDAKGQLRVKTTFNAPVSIESPGDFIPLKELQKDIEAAIQEISNSYSSPTYDPYDELDYSTI